MKRLIVAGVALVSLAFAQPALANVVEVTTSVPLAEVGEGELAAAIESAVSDALSQAIAFTPTVVALTNAAVVGERLYLRVLAADADGEKTLGALGLSADPKGEALPAEPAVSKEEIRI
jgi:hypothetical protein